jgi:myo-inositol-1(or 4)-monophosphatase
MTSAAALLEIARTIAVEAGELIYRRRQEGVEVAASKSSSVDVVTHADRESEEYIRARLLELRPADGFFGEEGAADTGTSGLTWVVDPIDGTVNYLYGIPQYAVSIAVVEGDPNPETWSQVAGAVFNPAIAELFTASAGGGAYLGNTRLQVNRETTLAHALVATGFGYSAATRAEQAALLSPILPLVRDIRRPGAASLDLAGVACGRLDAYYERGTQPWDHAAGTLLVREAGGVVTGLGDNKPGVEMVLATNAALLPQLLPLLTA